MKKVVFVIFLVAFAFYEIRPVHYHALLCTDLNAVEGGGFNHAYDGYIIGANGCLYEPSKYTVFTVPSVLDRRGDNTQPPIVYINGANHRVDWVMSEMQLIASSSLQPVVAIYNSTAGGRFPDVITDTLYGSKSTDTVQSNIRLALESNRSLHLKANSQGAVHVVAALNQFISTLTDSSTEALFDLFKNIRIETAGGAASVYPDGPRYVHYVNELDPVPGNAGVTSANAQPGKNAKIIVFRARDKNPLEPKFRWIDPLTKHFLIEVHGFNIYDQYWKPFN